MSRALASPSGSTDLQHADADGEGERDESTSLRMARFESMSNELLRIQSAFEVSEKQRLDADLLLTKESTFLDCLKMQLLRRHHLLQTPRESLL